jgi:hypothetical protein
MRKFQTIRLRRLCAMLALASVSTISSAVDFSYSGFANITAGKVYGSSGIDTGYPDPTQWPNCPCYIAEYSHASVYESRWSLEPETRAGIQGNVTITPDLSFTGQVMARHAAREAKLEIEWAFLTYNLTPKFTVQVGRKRLPLFYYSDFQDVAFAYNWARVPPDVYGWAVVNFNGANITFRDDVGGWAVKSSAYVGQEHSKNNPLAKLDNPARRDVNWDSMVGIDVELNRDWFTARASYNQSKAQTISYASGSPVQTSPDFATYGSSSKQTFSSLSFNIDKDNWVARSEFSQVTRSPARSDFKGYMVGGGYRIGDFLPMVTISRLNAYSSGANPVLQEVDRNVGFTLRYQINDTSALKVQVDRSRWDYLDGTDTVRKLATISYDMIF